MRNTRQKNLILSIVNNSCTHPTAEEIHLLCQNDIPNISLGTVYRNLNLLVEQGLIKRIKMSNNVDKFDHLKEKHAHFICIKCNKVIDLDVNKTALNVTIGKNKVLDYEINYRGICEDCQKEA